MIEIFKKRWDSLLFAFGVLTILFAAFKWIDSRLTTLDETPGKIQAIEDRIGKLEKRIRYECQHVGEFQVKDIESLLKMAKQRSAELRRQRDDFMIRSKDGEKLRENPIFVTLEETEKRWLEITKFLREEQRVYHKITLACSSDSSDADESGGVK